MLNYSQPKRKSKILLSLPASWCMCCEWTTTKTQFHPEQYFYLLAAFNGPLDDNLSEKLINFNDCLYTYFEEAVAESSGNCRCCCCALLRQWYFICKHSPSLSLKELEAHQQNGRGGSLCRLIFMLRFYAPLQHKPISCSFSLTKKRERPGHHSTRHSFFVALPSPVSGSRRVVLHSQSSIESLGESAVAACGMWKVLSHNSIEHSTIIRESSPLSLMGAKTWTIFSRFFLLPIGLRLTHCACHFIVTTSFAFSSHHLQTSQQTAAFCCSRFN